jgi:hypothetical protein
VHLLCATIKGQDLIVILNMMPEYKISSFQKINFPIGGDVVIVQLSLIHIGIIYPLE